MSKPLPRQIANLIENYNADVRAAIADDVDAVQLMALMGAICETTLNCIEGNEARVHVWNAVVTIMAEKFEVGEL